MFPFIIQYKDIYLPTFFFMIMVASTATTFYVYYQAKKKGLSQIAVLDISLIATLMGIIGARLFHVFVEAPDYYWEAPVRVLYFWQGGFVGYGAFIGVTIGILTYIKLQKLSFWHYADLFALSCPLIIFFIRIGCLGAGCCYGKPTDFWLHLTFSNPSSEAGHKFPHVALHATQIYDLLNATFVFLFVHWVDRRKKFQGQVTLCFFMTYTVLRFFIEFLRGDADRGVYFNGAISTSQITGIVILIVGTVLYSYLRKTKNEKQNI